MSHGHRKKGRSSITYTSWRMMIQRCTNKKVKDFELYGGRGIKVDFMWQSPGGFAQFLEDVGKRPSRSHTLDRIDPDGDYKPGNVRWATKSVQNSNKSGFIYEVEGERFTLYEKARELKMHAGSLRKRLSRLLRLKTLSVEEARRLAFTTPKGVRTLPSSAKTP